MKNHTDQRSDNQPLHNHRERDDIPSSLTMNYQVRQNQCGGMNLHERITRKELKPAHELNQSQKADQKSDACADENTHDARQPNDLDQPRLADRDNQMKP